MKRFKAHIQDRKQSGGPRKHFQFYEELHDVLKDRHDIYPPVVMGSNVSEDNVAYHSSDSENKQEVSSTAGTAMKRECNETGEANALKRKKVETLDTVLVKHLETMIHVQESHAKNESRRLDLMEKLIDTMNKNK